MNIALITGITLLTLGILGLWYCIIREQKEHRKLSALNNWVLFIIAIGIIVTTLSIGDIYHKL